MVKLINLLFGKEVFNKVITRQNRRTFSDNLLSQYYNDDLKKRVYKIYQKTNQKIEKNKPPKFRPTRSPAESKGFINQTGFDGF